MPGPSRSKQRGGPSDRRDGAQRQRRTRRQPPARHARRVSWSRRVGIAGALLLLAGGSIAFASQSLPKGTGDAVVGAPPPPALTVLPPPDALTRSASLDLTAVAPQNLRHDQSYVVRIFVNGQPVRRMDLPDHEQFVLPNVPLAEGVNSVQASLVGDGGESPLSAPVSLTRDDIAPEIKILQPTDAVYTDSATLIGQTEPGADIEITDGSGRPIRSSIGEDGRFSADLTLRLGSNDLTLRSTDPAGNRSTGHVTIERPSSAASIELTVTPSDVYAADLPATVELTAIVRDELGRPIDDEQVVFGVSPPDRATTTYSATTTNGRARFNGVTVAPGDATGAWLATALATLPSGIELRANASFSVLVGAPKSSGQR
jgi:hypothetical protein